MVRSVFQKFVMVLPTYLFGVLCFSVLTIVSPQELISPCPDIFTYERNASEPDRWYGSALLTTDQDLFGVWIRIVLDAPSLQLGNWFGEVEPRDNNLGYLIKNPSYKVKAKTALKVNFYVRYDPTQPPPKVVSFRLNAVVKCPEAEQTTEIPVTTGELFTNAPQIRGPSGSSQGSEADKKQGEKLDNIAATICGTVDISQLHANRQFPWHASLYHSQRIDLTYICGASLISSQHLITAASCVTKKKSTAPVDPNHLAVYLGKSHLRVWTTPGIQNKPVEKVIVHSDYNPQSFANNIAVLKLTEPVEFTSYVRPICLWEGSSQIEPLVNQFGSVVGWGSDEDEKVTGQLINTQMLVEPQESCIKSFPEVYSQVSQNLLFCAGFENNTSVCNGDSGTGLILPKSGLNSESQVWQIRGLVSVSNTLQNRYTCDPSHFVLFTDIAQYLDFVNTVIKE